MGLAEFFLRETLDAGLFRTGEFAANDGREGFNEGLLKATWLPGLRCKPGFKLGPEV